MWVCSHAPLQNGYEMVTAIAEEVEQVSDKDIEWSKCSVNFYHFLKYGKIKEPPPGGGVISFALWPHLLKATAMFLTYRMVVILKARQIGWSWLLAAYSAWHLMFQEASVVLMTSKGEVEASELMDKVRFIINELPDWMRLKTGADGATRMTFPSMKTEIHALPSTQSAGIGKTATLIIADEWDFHPYAWENYTLIKPTVDAGGQVIGGSTVDPYAEDTLFRKIYRESMNGKGGYKHLFIPWNVRPGRNKNWLDNVVESTFESSNMPKELYKEKNYPSREEEALAPPKSVSAFDHDKLLIMENFCRKPSKTIGPINIYQDYIVGHIYGAFTDGADGTGLGDNSVTGVMDFNTGMVVADIQANNIGPEEFVWQSIEMLKLYKNPLWAIEVNGPGELMIKRAVELDYKNFFYQEWQKLGKRDESKKQTIGWRTKTGANSRALMWQEGIAAVSNMQWIIPNIDGVKELYHIVRRTDKKDEFGHPKIMAQAGRHDDYATMLCGVWQVKKYVRKGSDRPFRMISTIR